MYVRIRWIYISGEFRPEIQSSQNQHIVQKRNTSVPGTALSIAVNWKLNLTYELRHSYRNEKNDIKKERGKRKRKRRRIIKRRKEEMEKLNVRIKRKMKRKNEK